MPILETDKLCKNCFRYLLFRVSDCLEAGTAGPSDKDSGYVDKAASIIELNKCVSSLDIEVSPFRMPDELRKRSLRSYSGRKQSQVEDAVESIYGARSVTHMMCQRRNLIRHVLTKCARMGSEHSKSI